MTNQKSVTWPLGPSIASSQTLRVKSWLIGKWREFRPSSSWVFGSCEVVNSGTAGGTENGEAKLWKTTLTPKVCINNSEKFFYPAHALVCPKPSRNPPNTSKHFILQAFAKTRNLTLTHQHHQPTSFDAMFFLSFSPTVNHGHRSLFFTWEQWFSLIWVLSNFERCLNFWNILSSSSHCTRNKL